MPEKYALVTGASSGIGLEMAILLAARAYNLVLVSIEEDQLKLLQNELSIKYKVKVEIIFTDLSRIEAAEEIFRNCSDTGIEVEVLVNNAGFYFFSEVAEANLEKARQMLQLHILTTTQLCTLFGKQMKSEKSGYILNVSSISAFKEFPGIAHYGSTKAYIKFFTLSLRTELKPEGVIVSCLCPGATLTNLYDSSAVNVKVLSKLGIMLSARRVASSGIKGLFAGKRLIVPGLINKVFLVLLKIVPAFLIQWQWNKQRI